jgi:hypothetical protein
MREFIGGIFIILAILAIIILIIGIISPKIFVKNNKKPPSRIKILLMTVVAFFIFWSIGDITFNEKKKSIDMATVDGSSHPQYPVDPQAQEQEAENTPVPPNQTTAQTSQEATRLPIVTVAELVRAYDENTVAADAKFKDKEFQVSGTIDDINTDIIGNPYVTLRGGNELMPPQFGFDKGSNEALAKLKKGMKVTMVCTGQGDITKTPVSGNCSLL